MPKKWKLRKGLDFGFNFLSNFCVFRVKRTSKAYTSFEVNLMFELTLCLDFDKQKYISQFYREMIDSVKSDDGIIIKHNSCGKSYLCIAVSETNKEYLKSKVLDFVTMVIENDFKYNFFKERLDIKNQELLTEAFLKAITCFDVDFDKEIISETIEFLGEIVIESLFYFKLQGLVNRWKKTADIINQNLIMNNDNSMSEVLRYLCAMSENNSVLVDILIKDKQIELKNFMCRKKFKKTSDGISKMFAEIVQLNPLKINIKEKDNTEDFDGFKSTLLKVFNDKIYFI